MLQGSRWEGRGGSPRLHGLAPMGHAEIDLGTERHDAGRVNGFVAAVIVALDVIEIDRAADSARLVNVARVGPEIRVVCDPAAVALEMPDIHGVEPDKRRKQAEIALGHAAAAEKTAS